MTTTIAAAPTISLHNVSVTRGGNQVLRDLSLELREQRIAILGPNGSGKSTLLRLCNALLTPTAGSVTLGATLDTRKHAKQIRRQVGFVFQNPENQIVMPIVAEDIAFGLQNIGLRGAELQIRVDAVLERLELAHLRDRETASLSGGEQQMLALAAVLVMEPSSIIFDEPTTMLDLRNALRVRREIGRLTQRAIIATHDLELARSMERAIVLDRGELVFDGEPDAAISFYQELCTAA